MNDALEKSALAITGLQEKLNEIQEAMASIMERLASLEDQSKNMAAQEAQGASRVEALAKKIDDAALAIAQVKAGASSQISAIDPDAPPVKPNANGGPKSGRDTKTAQSPFRKLTTKKTKK